MDNRNGSAGVLIGWVGLIISVLALILALIAFNRSGEDIGVVIDERTATLRSQFQADLRELETSIRQDLSAQLDEAADEVETATTTATTTLE